MTFTNKAEQVGVLSPYSINTSDIGKNWKDIGAITVDARTISYLGNGIIIMGDGAGHIFRSVDYGNTWTDLGVISPAFSGFNPKSSVYLGNGIAIIGDDDGRVFRSTDFGFTWTNLGFITTGSIPTVYLGNGIAIIADFAGIIYRSTDFGLTWSSLGVISAFSMGSGGYTDNGIAIIGDLGLNLFRSTDFGATWTNLGNVVGNAVGVSYLGNGITIIGTVNGHVFRSVNFGLTWTDLGAITGVELNDCLYLGDGIVVFGTNNGHIFRSTDSGLTWTDLGAVVGANATSGISYLGNGIVILGTRNGHIWRSDISYKLDENIPTVSVGMSAGIGNTSGTTGLAYQQLVIAGGNNITVSQSITSGSATLTISAAAVGAGSFSAGVSSIGNTSGATGTVANQLILAGGNNVTLSESINGQSATVTISAGAASFTAGVSTGGNTLGSTGTVSQRLIFVGGNNITLSQSSNAGSATITISAGAASFSAGVSSLGNTLGSTGTVSQQIVFVGGNNITLSQSSNAGSATITISTPNMFNGGISSLGNTSGGTGTVSQQIVFVGGNNITLSGSVNGQSETITISAAAVGAGSFTAGVSSLGNTSGVTGMVANRLVLAGGNNVTLSESVNGQSATVTISAGVGPFVRLFQPIQGDITSAGLDLTSRSVNFFRISMDASISATRYDVIGSILLATNSTGGYSLLHGIYTMTGSTANLITNSTTNVGSTFTSGSATSVSGQYGGQSERRFRSVNLGGIWAFTPGEYLFAMGYSAANGVSMRLAGPHRVSVAGIPGGGNYTDYFYDGLFSTSTNAFPLSVTLGDIIRTGDNLGVWWLALVGT